MRLPSLHAVQGPPPRPVAPTRRGRRVRAAPGRDVLRRAVWALAQLRAGRSLTAPALASHFEVSLRTAYRDFDFLRDDWNVPIEFDYSRGTYRLTAPTALVAPITLSRGEIVALFFAEKVLAQYRGTPFEADLETALRKVRELLPEEVSVSPGVLDACLSLDPGPTYRPDPRIFADVLDALSRRRVALVRYCSLSGGRTTDRRIHPCHVFNHRGDWYVAAWDETRRQVRDFALHRILRISLTHDACEVPVDFDFRRYGGDAFGIEKGARPVDVVIRFAPRQARWIRERQWHPSARVRNEADGGCRLHLRVSGLDELKRWVMQFGAEAEVLKPASLRREVARELREASKAYERD